VKNNYIDYENITKDILDSIKVGNLIKCNGWKKPMKVVGVSENYFVMITNNFGKIYYSVCEKKAVGYSRNNYTEGFYRIGDDDYVFGRFGGYNWDNEQFIKEYLQEFENGETQLSVRRAIDLNRISIKQRQ
jgi:hypothetical protein